MKNELQQASNICYRVGSQSFYNTFLAAYESWRSGVPVEFYCFDHEYGQIDWSQEPVQTLDEIMLTHAQYLRNRYEHLVLLFSGGTDSQTIYNIFVRNHIPIDHIIIKVSDDSPAYPHHHWQWLIKNHPDPHTRITKFEANDPEIRGQDLADADWIFANKGDMYKFMASANGLGVQRLIESFCPHGDYAAITGQEKPKLVYRQGRWYSRQVDVVLRHCMGYHYLEHFFLTPLVNLKQSHMVKQSVQRVIQEQSLPLYDGDWAEAKWPSTAQGYRDYATACGRHPELTPGISHIQKRINMAVCETPTLDIENITKELALSAQYQAGGAAAAHYVQGIRALHNETRFARYLNEHFLKTPFSGQMINTKFIWSKEYDLGA